MEGLKRSEKRSDSSIWGLELFTEFNFSLWRRKGETSALSFSSSQWGENRRNRTICFSLKRYFWNFFQLGWNFKRFGRIRLFKIQFRLKQIVNVCFQNWNGTTQKMQIRVHNQIKTNILTLFVQYAWSSSNYC